MSVFPSRRPKSPTISSTTTGEKRAWKQKREDLQSQTEHRSAFMTKSNRPDSEFSNNSHSTKTEVPPTLTSTTTSTTHNTTVTTPSNAISVVLSSPSGVVSNFQPEGGLSPSGPVVTVVSNTSGNQISSSVRLSVPGVSPAIKALNEQILSEVAKVGEQSSTESSHSHQKHVGSFVPPSRPTPPRPSLEGTEGDSKISRISVLDTYHGDIPPPVASTVFGIERPQRASELKSRRLASNRDPLQENSLSIKKKELKPGPELDKRRALIVGELLTTEETHVSGLTQLCEKYRDPIIKAMSENSKMFDARHRQLVEIVFSDVHHILKINTTLLKDLQEVYANWTSTSEIGGILCAVTPFLRLYTVYSSNYDKAIQSLNELFKEEWIGKFITDRFTFESLLILPIQRLPRYRMLVEDLILNTPTDHPDYEKLNLALDVIKKVATFINSAIRQNQSSALLTNLGLTHLIATNRYFVKSGLLTLTIICQYDGSKVKKVKKPITFYLFNDLLFVTRDKKGETNKKQATLKYAMKAAEEGDCTWPLELVLLQDIDDESFELIGPMKTITVQLNSKKEKLEWWNALNKEIESVLKEIFPNLDQPNPAVSLVRREGRFEFPGAGIYDGWWDLGRMQGKGVYEYRGTYYEGDFLMNTMQGQGTFEYANGALYQGEFASGMPHGMGTYCTSSGDKYLGNWVKGKRDGQGEVIFRNGDRYFGEWKNNQIEGHGVFIQLQPYWKYTGTFVNGKAHGKGSLDMLEGTYIGEFEHGKRNGEGTITYKDGTSYVGTWKHDYWNGVGKLTTKQFTYSGTFVRGMFEGKGRQEFHDDLHNVESVYDGNFHSNLRHGKGKFTSKTGYVLSYDGDWQDGIQEGQADILYANQDIYRGPVSNGSPHGNGKMILVNGVVLEGKFTYGVFEGKVDVSNTQGDAFTVDEFGQVMSENCIYLLPPFYPILP
eukprot:TRINITY_DN4808_c0_g3_i2.p1 TRINITY_DN4808_c0_g3~~TRINITY_DN4808_c0_g3_i2.p1  ORF type:complete len:945 (+),score=204.11 TRINITY_DN4808_c0_g3_i2:92-2926(+)